MTDIQRELVEWGKRSAASQHLHTNDDKEKISTWKSDIDNILQVFNVASVTRVETCANFLPREGACNCNAPYHSL